MALLDRLRRRRAPDALDHDTDWRGDLDDVRDELDVRRTRRAMHDHHRADSAPTSGSQGE